MIVTSYHNHTKWSDGSASVQEMVDAARSAGLEELGFSDHFALPPGEAVTWALAPDSLDDYVAEIRQLIQSTGDIVIRLGLEVDFFPEKLVEIREQLSAHPFDYLIGSVHFVDGFPIDFAAQPWQDIPQGSRDQVWRSYWQLLRAAAQSRLFDVIGHFDLPKKFGFRASVDLTSEALSVLDAIAEADMAIEINTSGWDRPVCEAYPSLFYLQQANLRKIPLVINSDAHAPAEVTRYFDRARELAAQAGYTELARFSQRRRFLRPL
jgi:histidinol-phosphatase (PHP family)